MIPYSHSAVRILRTDFREPNVRIWCSIKVGLPEISDCTLFIFMPLVASEHQRMESLNWLTFVFGINHEPISRASNALRTTIIGPELTSRNWQHTIFKNFLNNLGVDEPIADMPCRITCLNVSCWLNARFLLILFQVNQCRSASSELSNLSSLHFRNEFSQDILDNNKWYAYAHWKKPVSE